MPLVLRDSKRSQHTPWNRNYAPYNWANWQKFTLHKCFTKADKPKTAFLYPPLISIRIEMHQSKKKWKVSPLWSAIGQNEKLCFFFVKRSLSNLQYEHQTVKNYLDDSETMCSWHRCHLFTNIGKQLQVIYNKHEKTTVGSKFRDICMKHV